MSYSSTIEPRYIPGHPSISLPDEDRADTCLILSRDLWHGHNVSYYSDEHKYSKQGYIREVYEDTIKNASNSSGSFCCCVFPVLFLATYVFCHLKFANDATEWIGLYMKEKALEKNPKAKEYNKIAKDYLETLDRPKYADEMLEKWKKRQEQLKIPLEYLTAISNLIIENTGKTPQTLEGTASFDGVDYPFVITPILNESDERDYGIFHTTLSETTRTIEALEKKLKEIGMDISVMENSLQDFHNAPIEFEKNVRNLISSHEFK